VHSELYLRMAGGRGKKNLGAWGMQEKEGEQRGGKKQGKIDSAKKPGKTIEQGGARE